MSADAVPDGDRPGADPGAEFGASGWVLVAVIVVAFLVVPAVILWLPPVRPFRFAYLVLPLLPALLLGATAVWSSQRSFRAADE